jgi:putative transposase
MLLAHKIRLNPTPAQEVYFYRASGIARFAWNWALADYRDQKSQGLKADWNVAKKRFRAAIDTEFPFVREVTKCAFEEAFSDLRGAISAYYDAKRAGVKKVKFPKRRKRSRKIGGFGLANDKFTISDHSIRVPKLGNANMAENLRFDGSIRTGRIVEDGGKWYAIITVRMDKPQSTATGSTGIDFGLKTLATLSTGEVYETQGNYRKGQRKLRSLQRSLSRKRKGSCNYRKQKARVSRHHKKMADRRKDHLHKFTTQVAKRYSVVCIEDLSLNGLCRTRLGKSFYDAGIGLAASMLDYKADMVQRVDRFYPSSKRCSACGKTNSALTLSDRFWTCEGCNAYHDRDRNASINIELEGLSLLAGCGYLGATPVEFAASTAPRRARQAVGKEAGTLRNAYDCTPER